MRVTVTHNKTFDQVKQTVDRGFGQIFQGIPIAGLQFSNQKREWNGQRMDFSFTANMGFLNVPLKGILIVEEKVLIVDIDLPSFLNNFIPEAKVKAAVESQVKGLLT